MNCRPNISGKRLGARCLTVGLLLFSMNYAGTAAFAGNAQDQLNSIEQAIVGNTNSKQPIEKRIKELELKVFAKVQNGSLSNRISGLQKFAGISDKPLSGNIPLGKTPSSVSSSGFMPPLPPQFDNGQDGIKQAPDHGGSNSSSTQSATNTTTKSATSSTTKSTSSTMTQEATAKRLEEAVKLHHSGKSVEAEQSLRIILANNPQNSDAYFSLGAIAESRGDLKTALEYYTSAMQANPNDSEAHDAVAELSRKITATANQPFYNPLGPPPEQGSSKVLQGRAWELGSNATQNGMQGQAAFTAPNIRSANVSQQGIPTVGVSQPVRQSAGASIGRSLARAALGAALSGTGLHCPVCHMLQGF
ncbi:MAG: tetratricopeptide repeat protein [Candidatus Obscuribacterales bacterium]|nr:tetratricopeptide repeat protein [Candidatus Obscuribacterales bacterium]